MAMDWLSVAEAANILEVGEPQVRRLARAGRLPSKEVGGVRLVSAAAVRERHRSQPSAGRPLSPKMAWKILRLVSVAVDHTDAGAGVAEQAIADEFGRLDDRSVRWRARRLLARAPAVDRWDLWLRRRADPRRVWVHPGVIEQMVHERRLHVGGGFAAASHVGAIGRGKPRLFYSAAADADAVVDDYRAVDDPDGEIVLMVAPSSVLRDLALNPAEPVPAGIALVDLLRSPDARERHLAVEVLSHAVGELNKATQL